MIQINDKTMRILAMMVVTIAAIIIFVLILIKLLKEERINKYEESLRQINFFKRRDVLLQSLFGTPKLYREIRCSRQMASNFKINTLNYLMKYFDFVINDETLEDLSRLYLLINKAEILSREHNVSVEPYIPEYVMCYISPQGQSELINSFLFSSINIGNLHSLVRSVVIKREKREVQRAMMTPELREAIIRRDNWTCRMCGNSVFKEPNLLLEVDHIIPLSKGGKTEPNNLQTLCWRCNRAKSDKIMATPNFSEDSNNTISVK